MTISAIRTRAMNFVDELNNPTTGKFSVAWWLDMANYIKDVVARETGHYLTKHRIALSQYTQVYAHPSTLCWGILRVTLDGTPLDPLGFHKISEDTPGWLWEYGFPNQPAGDGIEVVSSSTADTTQKLTCYGVTNNTHAVVTEEITVNGTTQVATTKVDWGDMVYFSLDAACAGTLTIREASGNATICTIAPGSTSAGTAPATGTPQNIVTLWPNLAVYPAPSEAKTLYLLAGTLPPDYTQDSDDPTTYGVPAEFHSMYSHGMAAMAELADIYDSAQDARASAHGNAFWDSVKTFRAYLDGMQMDRTQVIRFDNPHNS